MCLINLLDCTCESVKGPSLKTSCSEFFLPIKMFIWNYFCLALIGEHQSGERWIFLSHKCLLSPSSQIDVQAESATEVH